jgi:hypothetical protein
MIRCDWSNSMDLPDEVKKTLTEVLAKYAAGNAEIVRTYFSRPDQESKTSRG